MQLFIYYFSFFFLNILISAKFFMQHRYSKAPKNVTYLYAQNNFLTTTKKIDVTFFENLFILFFFSVKSNNNLFANYKYTSSFKSLFLKTYKRPLLSYLMFTILNFNELSQKSEEKPELTILIIKKTFKLFKKAQCLKHFVIVKTKKPFTSNLLTLVLLVNYVTALKTKLIFLNNLKSVFKQLNCKVKSMQYVFNSDFAARLTTNHLNTSDLEVVFLTSQLINPKYFSVESSANFEKKTLTYINTKFFKKHNLMFMTTFFRQRISAGLKSFKVSVNAKFFNQLKTLYSIRFNTDTTTSFLTQSNIQNQKILYLRKNKIFNKSRYSRNRQLYRTGVYWCFWFTIFLGVGIYFVFYRFTVNFGYHWWLTFLALSSFVFNRVVKYRLYNPQILALNFVKITVWFYLITKHLFITVRNKVTCCLADAVRLLHVTFNKLTFLIKNIFY